MDARRQEQVQDVNRSPEVPLDSQGDDEEPDDGLHEQLLVDQDDDVDEQDFVEDDDELQEEQHVEKSDDDDAYDHEQAFMQEADATEDIRLDDVVPIQRLLMDVTSGLLIFFMGIYCGDGESLCI